jgi:Xaa-Pro aminopeptidase
MNDYPISLEACRGRQRRLTEVMQRHNVDLAVVTQIEHVQYLAGPKFHWTFSPVAALSVDGKLTLVAPKKEPETAAADEVLVYESNWHSTMRNDQREASSAVLLKALGGAIPGQRVGVGFSSYGPHLASKTAGELVDLEPDLYLLRRRKDPDELALLKKAIAGTARMYEKAREMIRPGVTEIDVFNELQSAAVREFGEMMTGTGNDYRCGERGGPPRNNRPAQAGELYILDLGPAFRGYFSDNCRTIAVTDVSDQQQQAWEYIMRVFDHVMREVKPGKNCQELFHEAQAILDECPVGVFNHHLGHGIGLFPHEGPHLNPLWNDTFEVGNVFTAEPGLYAPELKAGMRLENDYVVTETGVELLTDFPLELKV